MSEISGVEQVTAKSVVLFVEVIQTTVYSCLYYYFIIQLLSSSSFHHRPASLIPEEYSISSGYHSSPTSSLNSSIQSHHSQNVVEDGDTGGNYVASNKGFESVARVVGITPKLSQLLWDFASHDTGYYGCELFSPNLPPSSPKSDTTFSPMEGTPSDIPLLYQEGT